MKFIVFAPQHNTRNRRDATGAFIPEAQAFLKHHGCDPKNVHFIDNTKGMWSQRREVLAVLNSQTHIGGRVCVAFFCHGLKGGIQLGFRLGNVGKLAKSIANLGDPAVVVAMYSCDCGRDVDRDRIDDLQEHGGNGGFADMLRDSLCQNGCVDCTVWAHTTAGHASRNPHVRMFAGLGSPIGGDGGMYVVPRYRRSLWRKWRSELRTPFRFDYPLMSIGMIHSHLA